MPVVSTFVKSLSPSGNRVYVTYAFMDQVGVIHEVNRYVASTTNHPQALIDLTPVVDARMIEEEVSAAPGRVEAGENPETIVNNPVHTTTKRLAKRLLFWMMRERDPQIVILLEPLIVFIRANFTAGQIATLLDLTTAQVTRLNTRINRILDNKADFVAFQDDTEEFGDA